MYFEITNIFPVCGFPLVSKTVEDSKKLSKCGKRGGGERERWEIINDCLML